VTGIDYWPVELSLIGRATGGITKWYWWLVTCDWNSKKLFCPLGEYNHIPAASEAIFMAARSDPRPIVDTAFLIFGH